MALISRLKSYRNKMPRKVNKVYEFYLLSINFLIIISLAFSICVFRVSENSNLRPKIFLSIGTRKVELLVDKADESVSLFEDQEIEMQCHTKFEFPENINRRNIVNLKCERNYLYRPDRNYYSRNEKFSCSPQSWNLYETSQPFNWCTMNTTSYLAARPLDEEKKTFQYLAAICYDTDHFSFKSLYYKLAPHTLQELQPFDVTRSYTPTVQLTHFKETFNFGSFKAADYEEQKVIDWVKDIYKSGSIIQNSLLVNEFRDELGSLLDLAWWPNLRLGNWERYETALATRVKHQHQSYDILAGVSGTAAVPLFEGCQNNSTLKRIVDKRNSRVPLFVWNYLHSTTNSTEKIVVIGVNSPFLEFYKKKDVVFCRDKCREVPWLKGISSSFRYSALGLIFCCTSEDVRKSKRLDGFSETDIEQKPSDPFKIW